MAAPIRFLSGRQQQQKIGIEGSTEDKKVLEVVGRAGIGTTSFEPSKVLDVRGDAIVEGTATLGNLEITGTGGVPASLNVASTLSVTGLSTFSSAVDVNAGLDVDGQADLDEVVVAGVATFNNAVDINSTLDVDGDTQLDDLNVAGVATFSSNVNATGISSAKAFANFDYLQAPFGSTVSFTVTVASKSNHRYQGQGSGQAYYINGVESPFLTLTPGRTYRFVHDNTGSHPLKFYLEADKTTLYETNVNFQNTYTEITVTDETPIVLHYQCTNHGFMGNAIQTNANVVNTNYPATIRSTLNVTGVSTFPQLDVSTGGLDVDGLTNLDEVVVAGVSTFTGNIVAVSAEFSGNVTIAGTLTAEDKTNIDSLGIVTARTGVRVDAGGLIVTSGVSTFTDSVDIDNGVGVVGGLTADSLTISGVTTGINAAGISSFVRIDVDGQADLDEVVVAGVATFQGAVNFDVNSEINIGTGVTILGNNLHVTGIVSAAQFIGDGSGITNLPGISTLGSSNLTDVNVSGTTTTAQLRVSGIGTAEKFFVSTGGFEVDGQSDLDELVVAGVSTFNANTNVVGDLSVTGDIGASGIITATGINLVAGSGLDVGAIGVLTALSLDISTGGIDVDGQATLDEVVVAGVATFSALADVNNRLDVAGGANIDQLNVAGIASFAQLDISTGGIDVDGQATLDEVVVAGASTFTGAVKIDGALDIGVAGVDVEGLTNLDELIVAGVSTFAGNIDANSALDVNGVVTISPNTAGKDTFTLTTNASNDGRLKIKSDTTTKVDIQANGVSFFGGGSVEFRTAYPSIDADNEIKVGTAIQLGKAGVITATSFSGDGSALTGIAATDHVSTFDLVVAGIATFVGVATFKNDAYFTGSSDKNLVWDSSDGNLEFADNAKATFGFGTGGDLQIYHDGSTSYIKNTQGELRIGVNDTIRIGNQNNSENLIVATVDGGVDLYHDALAKFSTTSTGVQVYGTVAASNISAIGGNYTGVVTATSFSGSGANLTNLPVPTTITVADESSDTTCFPLFATAATGDLGPKSGSNLTFNSSTGALTATSFSGSDVDIENNTNGASELKITNTNTGSSASARILLQGNGGDYYTGISMASANASSSGVFKPYQLEYGTGSSLTNGMLFVTRHSSADIVFAHNSSEKLKVTSSGITVTDTVSATTGSFTNVSAIGGNYTGVVTATSFSGSGANLTGIGTQGPDGAFRGIVVAGVSTFSGLTTVTSTEHALHAKQLNVSGVSTFSDAVNITKVSNALNVNVLTNNSAINIQNTGSTVGVLAPESGNRFKVAGRNKHLLLSVNDNGGDTYDIHMNSSARRILTATHNDGVAVSGILTATALNIVAGSGLDAGNTGIITAVGAEFNGTSHIKLPAGSTAQRPGSPTAGDLRYNSDDGAFEGYTDSWGAIGGAGGAEEVDTNVSSTSAVGVGSFATASFRSAEVVAQIVQIDEYQVGKYLMIHDGTTVTVIEQTAVATGDAMLGSFDGAINGSNVELRVNMVSSGIATVTTKISTVTV